LEDKQNQFFYRKNIKFNIGKISYQIKYDPKLTIMLLKKQFGLFYKLIPNFLIKKDIKETKHSNKYNTNLIITENMHQRKQMMYEKSDAFLILPGGVGTLDECFEVLTWCQLNQIVNKKIGIINFNNFWDPLISLINHLIKEEYMGEHNLNYFEELGNIDSLKIFLKDI